jgi:D-beta-D-heptose 7-phosphate kinase/D-beta-D-heptose 1-phosphate adenosyltransferase
MQYRKPRVLVLGDLMLDIWSDVAPRESNPEGAAVIVNGDATRRYETLGGAGLVAKLLKSLGLSVKMMSRVGEDPPGDMIHALLHEAGLGCKNFVFTEDYATPTKWRFINSHGMVVFRYDEESDSEVYLGDDSSHFNFERYTKLVQLADCVVIADYGKGYCNAMGDKIIEAAKYYGVLTVVGAKPTLLNSYMGADIVKINRSEAEDYLICETTTPRKDQAVHLAAAVATAMNASAAVVTSAGDGCNVAVKNDVGLFDVFHSQAVPCFPSIKNCVGAGDAFLAGFVCDLLQAPRLRSPGFTNKPFKPTRLRVAVAAASATSSQYLARGYPEVDPATPFLASYARRVELSAAAKVLTREEAQTLCQAWRSVGKQVVFTNGCFDLLHQGHLELLEQARLQGDKLIVALNTDDSVRLLKGDTRPVQDFYTRSQVLASLGAVDAVVPLDESDFAAQPELRGMLSSFVPDVLVKGAQYQEAEIVGWEEMVNRDPPGRIWRCPMVGNCSTTQLIAKVQNNGK